MVNEAEHASDRGWQPMRISKTILMLRVAMSTFTLFASSALLASVLLVVITVALLTACAPVSDPEPSETPVESLASEGKIAVYDIPQDWGSDAGEASGVLVEVDGCVRLDNSRVPIFPSDQASWDGETLTFGGDEYRLGDTIAFAGNEIGDPSKLDVEIPEGCSTGPFWVVGPHRE